MPDPLDPQQLQSEIAALRRQVDYLQAQAAAESSTWGAEALDSVPVLLAYVDSNLRYVFANRTYEAWFSLSRASLIGKTVEEVVGQPAYAKIQPVLARALAGEPQCLELRVEINGALHDLSASYVPKPDAEGNIVGVFAIVSDVTHVLSLNRELEQAKRLQSLGLLTGGVAHDFNNLLAVIQGNADLLNLRLGDADPSRQLVRSILSTVASGTSLTSRLLSFARYQDLSPQVVDLAPRLKSLAELLRMSLGDPNELRVTCCEGAYVSLDAAQLENSLLNLAANARDAMPKGGAFSIEVSLAHTSSDHVLRDAKLGPGDYVLIRASDTGQGIAPDQVDRVFDPFFTTKQDGKGTGLGLSMVHGFVTQSGGQVHVDSSVGQGTSVSMYFPLCAPPATSDSPATAKAQPPQVGEETILVVEDNAALRLLCAQMLQQHGYRVLVAPNGKEGLEILEETPVELLFTDVLLPGGLNGVDLAEKALESNPTLKVIYTTGYSRVLLEETRGGSGSMRVLVKPYPLSDLLRTVREALDTPR